MLCTCTPRHSIIMHGTVFVEWELQNKALVNNSVFCREVVSRLVFKHCMDIISARKIVLCRVNSIMSFIQSVKPYKSDSTPAFSLPNDIYNK